MVKKAKKAMKILKIDHKIEPGTTPKKKTEYHEVAVGGGMQAVWIEKGAKAWGIWDSTIYRLKDGDWVKTEVELASESDSE